MFNNSSRFLKSTLMTCAASAALMTASISAETQVDQDKILVFSKTADFRHKSIEVGVEAMKKLGKDRGFTVIATEETDLFTKEKLADFDAVMFLNTSGDLFTDSEEAAYQHYVRSGGGTVGIHLAAGTEMKHTIWVWFNNLMGGRFTFHPKRQEATMIITDTEDATTRHLDNPWRIYGEWYSYNNLSPDIHVLISLDEDSYDFGTRAKMGDYHPLAWKHEYDGGRVFYTGLGHTDEEYSNPDFLEHVYQGILYATDKSD